MKKLLGLFAVAGLLFVVAPSQHADAASLANPVSSAAVRHAAGNGVTEVQYRHGHRYYGHRRHVRPRPHWHRHHWRPHYGYRGPHRHHRYYRHW